MTTWTGGTRVRRGYYLDARSYRFVNVERDGTPLPGGARARYVKVPALAVMAAAPALGGLFVVALPFIGFGVTAHALLKKLGALTSVGATEMAATVAVPVPVRVKHLTGQEPQAQDAGTTAETPPGTADPATTAGESEARLDELQQQIEGQRGRR